MRGRRARNQQAYEGFVRVDDTSIEGLKEGECVVAVVCSLRFHC